MNFRHICPDSFFKASGQKRARRGHARSNITVGRFGPPSTVMSAASSTRSPAALPAAATTSVNSYSQSDEIEDALVHPAQKNLHAVWAASST